MTVDTHISTTRLLKLLKATIVADDGTMLTIQVLPDLPEATVQVARRDVRAWCWRRLETRAEHKNKAIRGSGKPPNKF